MLEKSGLNTEQWQIFSNASYQDWTLQKLLKELSLAAWESEILSLG